jgi:hypothetical protein
VKKLLNVLLVLASLIGYMEWGGGNNAFLFQVEYQLLFESGKESNAFTHPFVVVPLLGQVLLLTTLFQGTPSRRLTYIGLACLSLLLLFLFFIAVLGFNMRMLASTLPFLIIGILILRAYRRPQII